MLLLIPNQLTQKVRFRSVTNWSLVKYKNGDVCISGLVTAGNEPGDGEHLRSTHTSPIQCRIGTSTVITQSGSRYDLLVPRKDQDPTEILSLFKDKSI